MFTDLIPDNFQDNEMFKKIQRHRYMNIIRSLQLEKSIKIRHYSRIEEKLHLRMDRLDKVYCLFTVSCLFTVCLLFVYCLFIVCLLFVYCLFTVCLLFVYCLLTYTINICYDEQQANFLYARYLCSRRYRVSSCMQDTFDRARQ